jgi:hypothetical protein
MKIEPTLSTLRGRVRKGAGIVPFCDDNFPQVMSRHRAPKTMFRYEHERECVEQSCVNFLVYDEEEGYGS